MNGLNFTNQTYCQYFEIVPGYRDPQLHVTEKKQ